MTQPRDTGSEAFRDSLYDGTEPATSMTAEEFIRAIPEAGSEVEQAFETVTNEFNNATFDTDILLKPVSRGQFFRARDTIHTALQEARADLDMARTHIRSVEDALELEQNRTVELIAEWVEARQEAFLQRQRALGDEALLVEATTRAERAEGLLAASHGLDAPALKENADLRTRAEKLAEAAIREHIKWHGSTGHEGLSAALSPTVETEGEPEPS